MTLSNEKQEKKLFLFVYRLNEVIVCVYIKTKTKVIEKIIITFK